MSLRNSLHKGLDGNGVVLERIRMHDRIPHIVEEKDLLEVTGRRA